MSTTRRTAAKLLLSLFIAAGVFLALGLEQEPTIVLKAGDNGTVTTAPAPEATVPGSTAAPAPPSTAPGEDGPAPTEPVESDTGPDTAPLAPTSSVPDASTTTVSPPTTWHPSATTSTTEVDG